MKNKLTLFSFLLIMFFAGNGYAQSVQVQTIIPEINASGGMTIDAAGNLYVSDFGPGLGINDTNTVVYKIDKNDFSASVFAQGFHGASGACFDSKGNFYQANNNGNRISKISVDGTIEYNWAAEGFNVPIGVVADDKDNIFVCNCGSNSISKITPDGVVSIFATDTLFNCPNGLTIDENNNLYACNFSDGKVLKITPTGAVSVLAELATLVGGPNPIGNGHLTYAQGDLYVNLIGIGQIVRLCLNGNSEPIAGRPFGFSNIDGAAFSATFSKPNGIVASLTGDTLFVNGSKPSWVGATPSALHPANVRMVTGINSLPKDVCNEMPIEEIPLFSQISEGPMVENLTLSMSSAWADFDEDGDMDVFISVGNFNNRLYQNNGDTTFTLVDGIQSNDGGNTGSAVWGDYDNDGYLDIYASNNPSPPTAPEPNFLYKNDGPPNYTFTKITNELPAMDSNYTWSSSWVDYDNDGDLDLHVPENRHLNKDFFYENTGATGTEGDVFKAIQPEFVTDDQESTGVVSWMDYDNDGDQDLFMIKSGRTHPSGGEDNRIFHNRLQESGQLAFQRVTTAAMVNHLEKDFQASWGDYDNDGDMDVYLGNFDAENYLYRNEGDSLFTRITEGSLATDRSATLGSSWGDYDNDGDLDLFVSNTLGQASAYYENDGEGNFSKRGANIVGAPVVNRSNTQSCANVDFNNDGYLDLFLANAALSATQLAADFVYFNNGGNNNFLLLNLRGVTSNSAAIGTKLRIKTTIDGEEVWQMRVISGGPTGDRAQNSLRVHFGIGQATTIDSLVIEWTSGAKDVYTDVDKNLICQIREGGGNTCNLEPAVNISTIKGLQLFKIMPNPVNNDTINIRYQIENTKRITFELYDLNGRLITSQATQNLGQFQMSIPNVAAGVYIVRLKTIKGTASRKVTIL